MSRNTTRFASIGLLGVTLAGLTLSTAAFATQPLAHGTATQKAAEGKCGEGKCGDAKFAQIDTDHDGRVSRAEFLVVAPGQQATFAEKDVNHDGYISERESYESIKAIYEAHGKALPHGLFAKYDK